MQFLRPPASDARKIALFAGAFHPPTIAHAALADAALARVEQTVWVLPRRFPHKDYSGVSLERRCEMILAATNCPLAIAEENYFFEMARELGRTLPEAEVHLLLGEDGAERLFTWDYGLSPEATQRMLLENLRQFPLLSARRAGAAPLPAIYSPFVHWLDLPATAWGVSSTEIRTRIAAGMEWREHVPAGIHALVADVYGSASS
jgi:nicotinate-nucleotide adenylyltransferase